MCPDGHTQQKQGNGKPAAQCPKRRRREPLDRWVATRREVLEVFQDTRVNPQAVDNLGAPSGSRRSLPQRSQPTQRKRRSAQDGRGARSVPSPPPATATKSRA